MPFATVGWDHVLLIGLAAISARVADCLPATKPVLGGAPRRWRLRSFGRVGHCRRATVVGGQLQPRRLERSRPMGSPSCRSAGHSDILGGWRRAIPDASSYGGSDLHAPARLEAAAAASGALILGRAGELGLGCAAGLLAAALACDASLALRRARRSGVGADSETRVRRALEVLERDGWRARHSLDWPGRGDLDHVVRSPLGVGFMIETKTLRYARAHLERAADAARWVGRRRRGHPSQVYPVICLVRARQVTRAEGEVLIVSLDRLVSELRSRDTATRRGWIPRPCGAEDASERDARSATGRRVAA